MATAVAILKKVAIYILTDKKARKFFGGILLGILVILMMPIFVLLGIMAGGLRVDENQVYTMLEQNMTPEVRAEFQFIEDGMYQIEDEMEAAGYSRAKIEEAQIWFSLIMYDRAKEPNFIPNLLSCFAINQTDGQLVHNINQKFGTEFLTEDYTNLMSVVRAVYIDVSGYTDLTTKNNLDLAKWAIRAEQSGWGYVWGTYGNVLDNKLFKAKKEQYPEEVGGYAEFIRNNWLGKRTADCVGLIKGYGWFNPTNQEIEVGTNGMPDIRADTMYANAIEKGSIGSIPEIVGLAVWQPGHIGIYIGNGEVVHASTTTAGVIRTPLRNGGWRSWLKIPYIEYLEMT